MSRRTTNPYIQIALNAVLESDWPAIHKLLDAGKLDPNVSMQGSFPGQGKTTLLASAIGHQRSSLALKLIRMGANVNSRGSKINPLILAVDGRLHDVIEELLNHGAEVNQKGRDGITALVWASAQGDAWAVKRLLAAGADPTALTTTHKVTGIYHAMAPTSEPSERLEILKLLHAAGCPLLGNEIHAPVMHREVEKVRMLVKLGCPVNIPCPFTEHKHAPQKGETPLTLVAEEQAGDPYVGEQKPLHPERWRTRREILRILLKAGADPNVKGREHHTPIDILKRKARTSRAAEKALAPMIKILLQAGAKRTLETPKDFDNRVKHSPIKALLDQSKAMRESIVKSEAEQGKLRLEKTLGRKSSKVGAKAFVEAVIDGNIETVREMLRAGTNVNLCTRSGETALLNAVAEDNTEMVRLLLDSGARPIPDRKVRLTELMMAVQNSNVEMIELLLAAGMNVNERAADGGTVLHAAVIFEKPRTLQRLLAAGASPEVRDNEGQTPLETARQVIATWRDNPPPHIQGIDFGPLYKIVKILSKAQRG